jgi:hypothetical protein
VLQICFNPNGFFGVSIWSGGKASGNTSSDTDNEQDICHWFVLYLWLPPTEQAGRYVECSNASKLVGHLAQEEYCRKDVGMHIPIVQLGLCNEKDEDAEGLVMYWRWRTKLYEGAPTIDAWLGFAWHNK